MNLEDKIESVFRLNLNQKTALKKLGLQTIQDLIFYFPSRYTYISETKQINTLKAGEVVTIIGKISKLKTSKSFKSKIPMSQGTLSDLTGSIHLIWFNQPYLAKMIKEESVVRVTGKVVENKTYGLTLTNPEINKDDILPIDLHDSLFFEKNKTPQERISNFGYAIYGESKGISSKWFYHAIKKILSSNSLKKIEDYLPKEIKEKYNLPSLQTALIWIHRPQKKEHAEISRKRFAFEEVFFIQLARQKERQAYEKLFSYKLKIPQKDIKDFISRFPFKPTASQTKAIQIILEDLQLEKPMSRLLEGDVGSGKTFVAATISYAVIKNRPLDFARGKPQTFGNLQVAYMAPTEVLSVQLFENFIQYFEHTGISIGLITGSGCRKFPSKSAGWQDGQQIKTWTSISRNQLSKWVQNGEIPIVIGTHALISKSVHFKDLGLVIIDEQHRFGTNQRMRLAKKQGHAPHYLSMTATPIPRTLALTIYGDLDLSIIDEMPAGRKKVITEIISENKRETAYEEIRKQLQAGRQMYVICPKIEEDTPLVSSLIENEKNEVGLDTNASLASATARARGIFQQKNIRASRSTQSNQMSELKSVTSEAKRLKKDIFPNYNIDIMHSKMTKQKKEKVMRDFAEKKIDILVSTSVIEVGVSVENATVIIIEGAERFGLAQLHQLRGRVIRSTFQSYCYLFANIKNRATSTFVSASQSKTIDRLKALTKATNGFELAELDLTLRGAGLLSGDKQWGITDLGMEAIKNIKMVEAARTEAIEIIKKDLELKSLPFLAQALQQKNLKLHFE